MSREHQLSLPLMHGGVDAVRDLSSHWPLAVASGSPMSLIETVLEGGSFRDQFQVLVSTDEVVAGKPAPDVYLRPHGG